MKEDISLELVSRIDNLSKSQREDFWTIFDYWNLLKGQENLQKQVKWKSCRKVTEDVFNAIAGNIRKYSQQEICIAIENYATTLFDDRTFWSYVWSLPIFLTVKEGKYKDAPKKWVQKFHPENFVFRNYLKDPGEQYGIIKDPDSELTKEIIEGYKNLISNSSFVPNAKQKQQFIQTTVKMLNFFERRKSIFRQTWVRLFVGCLFACYIEKGENCFPGHLCCDHIWSIVFPQYLQELGMEVE